MHDENINKLGKCKVCKNGVSSQAETCPKCGSPRPYDWLADMDTLVELYKKGGDPMFFAMRTYREVTGRGLKETKDFFENEARKIK